MFPFISKKKKWSMFAIDDNDTITCHYSMIKGGTPIKQEVNNNTTSELLHRICNGNYSSCESYFKKNFEPELMKELSRAISGNFEDRKRRGLTKMQVKNIKRRTQDTSNAQKRRHERQQQRKKEKDIIQSWTGDWSSSSKSQIPNTPWEQPEETLQDIDFGNPFDESSMQRMEFRKLQDRLSTIESKLPYSDTNPPPLPPRDVVHPLSSVKPGPMIPEPTVSAPPPPPPQTPPPSPQVLVKTPRTFLTDITGKAKRQLRKVPEKETTVVPKKSNDITNLFKNAMNARRQSVEDTDEDVSEDDWSDSDIENFDIGSFNFWSYFL